MIFAILLAISGLTLSAVAIYYSVIGLTAVFAAAFWPVVVMGTTLEVSKLVAASWLKAYWEKIPLGMKIYMSTAVVVLMLITSMGIFGFLSKAHLDQNIVSGDVQNKIAIIDEKIQTERSNIDAARKALAQMDAQVNERLSRSTDDKGAERAVQIRRQQQAERTRLQNDISRAQGNIARLNEEAAPVRAEVRKVEAEVGPIKYIAKLIYGDNPDTNILEKAVTWVIMIIVFVFDPLAVLMLLGAQMTWKWHREQKESAENHEEHEFSEEVKGPWPFMVKEPEEKEDVQINRTTTEPVEDIGQSVGNQPTPDIQSEPVQVDGTVGDEPRTEDNNGSLDTNDKVEHSQDQPDEQPKDVEEPTKKKVTESLAGFRLTKEQLEELDNLEEWNEAKHLWKEDNPNLSLKFFKNLYLEGKIDKLPWEDYLGKVQNKKSYIMKDKDKQIILETSNDDVKEDSDGYIQNEEQKTQSSIWKRIRSKNE